MVAIYRPEEPTRAEPGKFIDPGIAALPGKAMAQYGQTFVDYGEQEGRRADLLSEQGNRIAARGADEATQMANLGNKMVQKGNQFFYEGNAALQTAIYGKALSESTDLLKQQVNQRLNNLTTDDGQPNWMTLDKDINKYKQDIVDHYNKQISDPDIAKQYQDNFTVFAGNLALEAGTKARGFELDYIHKNTENSVASFADQASKATPDQLGYYFDQVNKITSTAVNAGAMSPEQQNLYLDMYMGTVEKNQFRNLINSNPQLALDRLKNYGGIASASDNPDAVAQGFTGPNQPMSDSQWLESQGIYTGDQGFGLSHIKDYELLQLKNEAQHSVDLTKKQAAAAETAKMNSYNELYERLNKVVDSGGVPDPKSLDILIAGTKGTPLEGNTNALIEKQQQLQAFSLMSTSERIRTLGLIESSPDAGVKAAAPLFKDLNDTLNKQIKEDPMGFAMAQGVIPQIQPVDFMGNLAGQLQGRMQYMDAVESHYGMKVSGLTGAETEQLKNYMQYATPQQKSQIFAQLVEGLGPRSEVVFKDLADKGASTAATAGVYMAMGEGDTAVKILQGQDVYNKKAKEYSLTSKEFNAEFNESISSTLNQVQFMNQKYSEDMRHAILSVYAQKTQSANDFTGVFDEDRFNEAVSEVLNGEPTEVFDNSFFGNGSYIIMPAKNMTAESFEGWAQSVSNDEITALGGFAGFDPNTQNSQLKNARYVQEGYGRYILQLPNLVNPDIYEPVFRADNPNKPFVLDFNTIQNMRTKKQTQMVMPSHVTEKPINITAETPLIKSAPVTVTDDTPVKYDKIKPNKYSVKTPTKFRSTTKGQDTSLGISIDD